MLESLLQRGFEVHLESHAAAILSTDFPGALKDLEGVLLGVSVPITEIIGSGGGETKGTQRMRHALNEAGWRKHVFEIRKSIAMRDFVRRFASEQKISSFADLDRLDIELTRRKRKQIQGRVERKKNPIDFAAAWMENFVADKYGEATTHWKKLMNRVDRGVGNPCPLLLIGLPASIVTFDTPVDVRAAIQNAAEDHE